MTFLLFLGALIGAYWLGRRSGRPRLQLVKSPNSSSGLIWLSKYWSKVISHRFPWGQGKQLRKILYDLRRQYPGHSENWYWLQARKRLRR